MNEGLEKLSLAALATIDGGKFARAFDAELDRLRKDLASRPDDKTKRRLTMTIECQPTSVDDEGDLDTVGVAFDVDIKTPKVKSKAFQMLAREGQILFAEHSPKAPKQGTIASVAGVLPRATKQGAK